MSSNRIDRHGTWLSVCYSFVLCHRNFVVKLYPRGGQPWRIFKFTLTNLSCIGAGVRYSWQRLWIVRLDVWPLASVLPGSASLSGWICPNLLNFNDWSRNEVAVLASYSAVDLVNFSPLTCLYCEQIASKMDLCLVKKGFAPI